MSDPITAPPAAPSRSAPSTFSTLADAFIAWFAGFVTQLNAVVLAMNWNALNSTSTTSLAIGTGVKSLTVDVSKSYLPGHSVKIARTSNPSNWIHGDVTSYDSGTGALVVNVTNIMGSGTFTDWTITFSTPMMNLASSISDGDTTHAPDGNSVFDALALKQAKSGGGLAITAGKTITCTQDTALDEAVAMSSKSPKIGATLTQVVLINSANAGLHIIRTSTVYTTTAAAAYALYLIFVHDIHNGDMAMGMFTVGDGDTTTAIVSNIVKTGEFATTGFTASGLNIQITTSTETDINWGTLRIY